MKDIFKRQKLFINEIESGLFNVLEKTIQSYDFVLKDYVVNKQLFQKGIDGNGKSLPGYTRTTIKIKISKGQPVDRTTLHDTEKFVDSIRIDAFSDRFEISSNVPYDKFIIKRYNQNKILKITDENFREFLDVYFLPKLKQFANVKIT